MGKWSKSLPEPAGEPYVDWAANALDCIAYAMNEHHSIRSKASEVRHAAAEVRAWRLSLAVRSERVSAHRTDSIRSWLRDAARHVLDADSAPWGAR